MRINHTCSAKEKAKAELKYSAFLVALKDKTPEEISNFVDNNLNDINDIRKFAKMTITIIQALDL